MAVFVTGDLHGGLDIQKLRDWEAGERLTRSDFLIVAGDFGYPWDFSPEECEEVAWLESRPYTLLFVDGNHERRPLGGAPLRGVARRHGAETQPWLPHQETLPRRGV